MSPYFSIVIPTYNRAAFLPTIIDSVLQQTFQDFEVVVVDDGSKDETRNVVQELIVKNSKIRYIYQNNAERGAARNNGIKNARGEFIVLVDSDDELLNNYLENLKISISQQPGFDFFACFFKFKEGTRIYSSPIESVKEHILDYEFFLHGNPLACNICFRRANPDLVLFEENRDFAIMEDWIFLIKNLYKKKLFLIHDVSLYMHQHPSRSMQQNQLLIDKRKKATQLLIDELSFSEKEKNILWGYAFYFCSIHSYLDYKDKQALSFLKKAVDRIGWNKNFIASLLKYRIGRSRIEQIKQKLLH